MRVFNGAVRLVCSNVSVYVR